MQRGERRRGNDHRLGLRFQAMTGMRVEWRSDAADVGTKGKGKHEPSPMKEDQFSCFFDLGLDLSKRFQPNQGTARVCMQACTAGAESNDGARERDGRGAETKTTAGSGICLAISQGAHIETGIGSMCESREEQQQEKHEPIESNMISRSVSVFCSNTSGPSSCGAGKQGTRAFPQRDPAALLLWSRHSVLIVALAFQLFFAIMSFPPVSPFLQLLISIAPASQAPHLLHLLFLLHSRPASVCVYVQVKQHILASACRDILAMQRDLMCKLPSSPPALQDLGP